MSTRPEPAANAGRAADRKQLLFLVLAAVFLTNAILAELIGGKLIAGSLFGFDYTQSVGIFLWPVVFVTSDIINEYFGRRGVRRLSILGAVMIAYAFLALTAAGLPAAASFSPVGDAAFSQVFFQSRWIIVGSITAFLVAQFLDVTVFWLLRRRTGSALLWVRATGSTLVSQLVDTFIVGFIGLHLPWRFGQGGIDFAQFLRVGISGYVFKFAIALGVTPLLYLVHAVIDRWLGASADELIASAAAAERS